MASEENSLRDLNENLSQKILSDPIYNVEKTRLSNGLTVIFNKDAGKDYAYMLIYVKIGARNDPPGKKGMAHLYEHLAFRKGRHNKFTQEMGKIALTFSASTTYSSIDFHSKVQKEQLPRAMELEALRFGNIGKDISQQDIDEEVEIIRNEYMNNQSLSGSFLYETIQKTLFRKSDPLWNKIIGEYADLCSITPEDILDFEKNFVPENTIMLISGDFEANAVFELVNAFWGNKEKTQSAVIKKARSRSAEQKHYYYVHNDVANFLLACYEEPGKYTRDWVLTKAALIYLSGDEGPVTKAMYSPNHPTPKFYRTVSNMNKGFFYYSVRGDNLAAAYETYKKTIENLDYESISKELLYRIQNQILMGSALKTRSITKMYLLAEMEVALGEPSYKTVIDQIKSITKEDIRYAIEKYVNNERHNTLSIIRKSHIHLVLPGAKEIKKDTSWFISSRKNNTSNSISQGQNRYSTIDRTPEISYNFPSPWRFRLSNGVRIFGTTLKDCGLIEGTIIIKLSRHAEKKGLSGINLYCAKAMTGTRELPPEKYREKVEMLNSEIVVKYFPFQPDSMEIYFKSYRKNIKELFGLIEESIITPHITEKSIEAIKGTLHRNFMVLKYSTESVEKETRLFSHLAFGKDHPFSREQQGYKKDKENISVTAVKEHCSDYIKPDITDICITGDITKEYCREVLSSLENRWQGKHKRFPAKQTPHPAPKGKIYVLDTPDNDNVHISFFRLAPPEKTKEYYIISLIQTLLGETPTSVLYKNLRENKGLAYIADSGIYILGKMLYFKAEANTYIRNAAEVFRTMHDTVFTYADIFNEDMLKFTLDHAIKDRNSTINDISSEVKNLKTTAFHDMNYNRRKWQGKMLSTITLPDVREVAGKFFDPSEFYFVVEGDMKKIMEPLSKLGYGEPMEIKME